jgi:hypothetical protein
MFVKFLVNVLNSIRTGVLLLSNAIIAGYDFIIRVTSDGVNEAGIINIWEMLRDICNMFFILILLIIGISTILGIKKYSYRKNLINVLISAFLINYSKVIIGMMIDFAQIFIIPFNNAIANSITLITQSAFFIDVGAENVWAAILGLIFALGFFAVAIVALVYSLIRLVFIWITIAVSPIIVLGYGVPFSGVKKSLKDFFQKFISFLVGGVLMSFFMWFSLYILSMGSSSSGVISQIENDTYLDNSSVVDNTGDIEEDVGITGVNVMLMIVSLAFLLYAQKFAISSSKQAGSFAGDIASKVGDIGLKPLNGLKGLGIKSARGAGNLSKKALMYAPNAAKDRGLRVLSNVKDSGVSSLRNRSNLFDKFSTRRDEIKKIGIKEWRGQQVDKDTFGGKKVKVDLKNETVDTLKQKKAMELARLESSNASVEEIKISGFNWDQKIGEKEVELAREKLKKAPSSERSKMTKELNSKRTALDKSKENKNKYVEELRNVQLGKSVKAEDSSQLKNVKDIMDNVGDGAGVNFGEDYKYLLNAKTGKFSKGLSPHERDQIMAEIIAKAKNKNLEPDDKKFINNNHSVLFRTVSQDVLSNMNSDIDKISRWFDLHYHWKQFHQEIVFLEQNHLF